MLVSTERVLEIGLSPHAKLLQKRDMAGEKVIPADAAD